MQCSSVLLVTAHPDDEAMFFAPTISRLQQQGASIHILCLSNGESLKQQTPSKHTARPWRHQHPPGRAASSPMSCCCCRQCCRPGARAGEGACGCSACHAGTADVAGLALAAGSAAHLAALVCFAGACKPCHCHQRPTVAGELLCWCGWPHMYYLDSFNKLCQCATSIGCLDQDRRRAKKGVLAIKQGQGVGVCSVPLNGVVCVFVHAGWYAAGLAGSSCGPACAATAAMHPL